MYVPIPKDLTKVKSKLLMGLTKRQLICFGIAALIGVPFYLFTHKFLGNSVSALLMIVMMLPLFFLAMYERDGMPAEKILRNIVKKTVWPAKRIYKTENLYAYLSKEAETHQFKQDNSKKTQNSS